ncbi:hypothetical protein QUA20_17670 [Microcoleus sp. Pol7_A1]|uniref:hypothetical protein n=1 Tax=Microcoleus sp. Pol7_A1 TaxID=2818893 RepID=UPI002FD02BE7
MRSATGIDIPDSSKFDKPAPTDLQRDGFTFTPIGLRLKNWASGKLWDLVTRNLETNPVYEEECVLD